MSVLVAGIDGGQSSTVTLIADGNGRVLSRGIAGPADEVGADAGSTRLRDALRASLADARRQAGLSDGQIFAAIVAGVSGYEGTLRGAAADLPASRFLMMHDAPIAHAGALGGEPGVIVIAGTGSVVYAVEVRGKSRTLGGWGYLFGDEGSAFTIARESLAAMMRAEDAASSEPGSQAACTFFGVGSLRELAREIYTGKVARDALASFAPEALRFPAFRKFARSGARRLADLVRIAAEGMNAPKVALLGGLLNDASFRRHLETSILERVPQAEIVEPRYEPAAGALLLAYRELGLPVTKLAT